jgi:hypothetical protein
LLKLAIVAMAAILLPAQGAFGFFDTQPFGAEAGTATTLSPI